MPATQTTYTELAPIGTLGQVVNMETANSISRIIEDAAGVGFGIALFQGVADLGVTKTGGTLFKGVSIKDASLVTIVGGTTDNYPQRSTVGLLDKGVIWVNVAAATPVGVQAYITSGGVWTNVSTSNTLIPGAYFDSSTAAAGLIKLRLR